MQDFKGRVVFITGATSGIGEEIALEFARQGAQVAFTGRRAKEGEKVEACIKALGAGSLFIKSDVKEGADIENAIQATVKKFGRIDIAVNNAGIGEEMTPFLEQKVEKFDEIIGVNVRGMWFCLQNEIKQMLKQNSACSIINISSVSGQTGFPQTSTYVASKHAVNGLTRSLASEFAAKNIRINAVAPGPIKTDMWDSFASKLPNVEQMVLQRVPMGRIGTVAEVASCVLWLASDTATFITGQVVVLDGGMVNI